MRYPSISLIEQIKRERKRKGITQAELASMLGLPQPSIARIEAGGQSPSLSMLERMCDALGLEMVVQKQKIIAKRVNLVVDMRGCPNRCLHCWLGELPNKTLTDSDAEWVASLFRPYFEDLTFYSWLREPDFHPDYRKRWEKDRELSSMEPKRFELASFHQIVCDPDYVSFLKEVGTKKVQLTFFGGEETTDEYVGRKGAYKELMDATRILLDNGIRPRWQFFVNMENKAEILPQIEIGKAMGVKEIFVHEGSCDGNNARLYDLRIERESIPNGLIPYYLGYDSLLTEAECCALLKGSKECFLPRNEGDITLNITSDFGVYFNFTNPSPAWCLGNLKDDPIDRIVRKAVEESVPALLLSKAMPLGRLVGKYGNPKSDKVFSLLDYKMYLLNRYLDEVYNIPKAMDALSRKVQTMLKDCLFSE